jgi:hypothetical protein
MVVQHSNLCGLGDDLAVKRDAFVAETHVEEGGRTAWKLLEADSYILKYLLTSLSEFNRSLLKNNVGLQIFILTS